MEKVSYVIPCYCSAKMIRDVVEEITDTMKGLHQYNYEIILVNDSSPDNTFDVIRELSLENENVIGVNLAKNFGQHAALMAGFHQVSGDIIVCLDDDGQTPANEVDKLLACIEKGSDVVYASYEHKQHSNFRNWGSRVNGKMTEVMLGKPKDLSVTSYFAVRRYVVDEILRYEHCYPYVIGLVLRSTNNICNVSVVHREREIGKSGYTFGKLLSLWINGFTSFSVKPLRVATYLGVVSAACGFFYLIYTIVRYFMFRATPMGWSSLVTIVLVLGGMILVVLGMIGEYIGRLYMCVNVSPQFVIREIVKHK